MSRFETLENEANNQLKTVQFQPGINSHKKNPENIQNEIAKIKIAIKTITQKLNDLLKLAGQRKRLNQSTTGLPTTARNQAAFFAPTYTTSRHMAAQNQASEQPAEHPNGTITPNTDPFSSQVQPLLDQDLNQDSDNESESSFVLS